MSDFNLFGEPVTAPELEQNGGQLGLLEVAPTSVLEPTRATGTESAGQLNLTGQTRDR